MTVQQIHWDMTSKVSWRRRPGSEGILFYVKVKCELGAYYFAWVTGQEINPLKDLGLEVTPQEYTLPNNNDATAEDWISDICFMVANSQYGNNLDSSSYTNDLATSAANAMRDTLEIMLEHMGQSVKQPPTEASQAFLEAFAKKSVHRMQAASNHLNEKAGY